MDNVLIDTDVILDFFFDRKPFSEHATKIFLLCENRKINGFVTPVIISNVYYLLRKISRHELIVEKIKQLMTIVDEAQMDKAIIIDALNSDFNDFEDALQNFSAVNNGVIKSILTRNTKDFKRSKLSVFTPEMYLANWQANTITP